MQMVDFRGAMVDFARAKVDFDKEEVDFTQNSTKKESRHLSRLSYFISIFLIW